MANSPKLISEHELNDLSRAVHIKTLESLCSQVKYVIDEDQVLGDDCDLILVEVDSPTSIVARVKKIKQGLNKKSKAKIAAVINDGVPLSLIQTWQAVGVDYIIKKPISEELLEALLGEA